ncbi:hypothetical protein [Gloeocapsopsis dulcis]|uniref:hypothetical protein n=1 Tax=Gloeocapsopsis dulcis TaxID=2859516 RepID=UPI00137A4C86|nr:hypothetical protein [Gloeocapsopsis dulcis]
MPYNRLLAPLPPGNFSFPVIGEMLSLLRDPQFAKKRHDKYGNIVRTNILGRLLS